MTNRASDPSSIVCLFLQAAAGTLELHPALRPRAQRPGGGPLGALFSPLHSHALALMAASMERGFLKS
jgi:hypothetical protein